MAHFLRPALSVLLPALVLSVGFVGCSDDQPHDHAQELPYCSLPLPCRQIVEACHAKDDATNADIHACHEDAHDNGTLATCTADHDRCVQLCNAAPSIGTPEPLDNCNDAAVGDAAHD